MKTLWKKELLALIIALPMALVLIAIVNIAIENVASR
jgi:hypothetical protein